MNTLIVTFVISIVALIAASIASACVYIFIEEERKHTKDPLLPIEIGEVVEDDRIL